MLAHQGVQAVRKCSGKVELFSCVVNEENKLELDLREADLREFPEGVLKLEGLKVLKLCTDHIHSLPRSISVLDELEELFLHTTDYERRSTDDLLQSEVGLREVPYCVTQLKQLQVLSVCGNPLVAALINVLFSYKPSSLIELEMVKCGITKLIAPSCSTKLRLYKLNLSGNSVKLLKLSELVDVTVLKQLNLSDCGLKAIPAEVSDMIDLEELCLSGNNKIKIVSPSVCRTDSKLRILDLSHCDIEDLPVELGAMTSLEKLRLAHNRNLHALPESAYSALMTLKHLDLSYSDMHLPADLCAMSELEELHLVNIHVPQNTLHSICSKLKNLKVLNLSNSGVEKLPADLSALNSLEKLYLAENRNLHWFPAPACVALRNLKVLDLSYCGIKELPAELCELTNLEELHLVGITVPPNLLTLACKSLTRMKVLNLAQCNIQALPVELSAMKHLETLDLSENKNVRSFPSSACASLNKLKVLKFVSCDMQELPAELSAMAALEEIDLSKNKTLYSFPASACANLKKLKVLNFWDCDIQALPEELSAMTSLEVLDLSQNKNLPHFPESACANLKMLKVFKLWDCDVQELPAELRSMTGLRELDLSQNKKLHSFPSSACAELNKLKILKFWDCDMQELPAELSALTCLEVLDLSWNKNLHSFPASACAGLCKLKLLKFWDCDMQELPAELSAMTSLEELDLSQNKKLHSFPSSACAGLNRLKVLKFWDCDMQSLPAELSSLTRLEVLDFSQNKNLRSFPASACAGLNKLKVLKFWDCDMQLLPAELIAMTNLEELDLSWNNILHSFPASACAGLNKLKVLNLAHCDIQALPEELSAMTSLEQLDLSQNKKLHSFPASACTRLDKLKVVKLWGCNMQTLPAELSGMTALEELDLSRNKNMQSFPASACPGLNSLKDLKIRDCDIHALPAELSEVTGLEVLDVSGNKNLHSFPASSCAGLTKLKVLKLSSCDMQALPAELSAMTCLEELHISSNPNIHSLPEAIFLSRESTLQVINTRGCPLVSPPIEICGEGVEAVKEYFISLQTTVGIRRRRVKILVMGKTMAGKTSLVKAIISGGPFLTWTEDRTIGLEETTIRFSEDVQWKVQDFGGQRAYILTNQLMVSDNAFALIVVDVSQYQLTDECFRDNIGEYLELLFERNSKAYAIIVMSKVDQLSDSEHNIRMKFDSHVNSRVGRFLNLRQRRVRLLERSLENVDQLHYEFCAERLRFLHAQSITVREDVVLTSSASYKGVGELWNLLGQLSENVDLISSIEAHLPASWVAVEDRLVSPTVPIMEVSEAVALSVEHGLSKGGTLHLLKYLHDVGSLMFFSRHSALRNVLFPSSTFVFNAFKAVFRHDHDRLCYDCRFLCEGIQSRRQFDEMKEDLVQNATVRIPMLLALWSEIQLSAEQYLEVFLNLFMSFDLAYLVTSSDDVTRKLTKYFRERGLSIPSNSFPELHYSAVGSSTTVSICRADDTETTQCAEEEAKVEIDLISMLKLNNVGLLLPWLLRDEEPPEVGRQWSRYGETESVQVSVRYSFPYNVPLGLFERLSARCHRHLHVIHHWRSGLLLRYGPVTLLFRCDRNPSHANISLRGSVQSSPNSCVRLWHVLLRCVADLEDLITTIPGVLVDGSIHDETCSGLSESSRPAEFAKFRPGTTWVPFVKEGMSVDESKHLEAIDQGQKCTFTFTTILTHLDFVLHFVVQCTSA